MSQRDDGIVLREMTTTLSRSGSGSGVSVHIDSGFASQFNLEPGTEFTIEAREQDGDVQFSVEETPTGFTLDEFRAFAADNDWDSPHGEQSVGETQRLSYLDPSGCVRTSMRSPGHVGDMPIDNVTVEGRPVRLAADPADRYQELLATAQQKGLDVQVTDSDGLWQQLKASSAHETDETPDLETIEQLVARTDEVTVQFVWTARSAETNLESVGGAVADIRDALDGLAVDPDPEGDHCLPEDVDPPTPVGDD